MSVKSYAVAIRDVIAEEMRRDEKVFISLPNSVPSEFATHLSPRQDLLVQVLAPLVQACAR